MTAKIARLWRTVRSDGWMLFAFLATALLALIFLRLASEVLEGETFALDRQIITGLRSAADPAIPIGPTWLNAAMHDITAIGDFTGLALITALVAGFLIVARKYRSAGFVVAAIVSGAILNGALKGFFERPRPDLVTHLVQVTDTSFPSGHAMNSAVVFLTLGALLARTQQDRAVRIYLLTVAILLTLAVGVSRVYLGVHWPSDVIAGWCVGATWASLCWSVARLLQRRHGIEAPGEEAPPA